jgi:hypothetical protein
MENHKPVLIVIDNLRMAFMDSDTNSNREMVKLMFTLVAICEATKLKYNESCSHDRLNVAQYTF